MNRIIGCLLLGLAIVTTGCDNWERTTFNTLSSSKAVIDQAQADYESRAIPKTACAKSIIENGKAVQTVAVNGFLDFERVKEAKGDTTTAQAAVVADLVSLAPLVVQVQALISNPTAVCGGK